MRRNLSWHGFRKLVFLSSFAPLLSFAQSLPTPDEIKALNTLTLVKSIPLKGLNTYHPQGMLVIKDKIYLSSVNGKSGALDAKGQILSFTLNDRTISDIKYKDITVAGGKGHLGGLDFDQRTQKIVSPLADYKKYSGATVIEIDPSTLDFTHLTWIGDHLGALALDSSTRMVRMFNWDSEKFMSLNKDSLTGAPTTPTPNMSSTQTQYQDCKGLSDDYAICGGQRPGDWGVKFGVLDLVRFDSDNSMSLHKRWVMPKVDPSGKEVRGGTNLTHNPMAVVKEVDASGKVAIRFYFAPHNQPDTSLLVFEANP